MVTLLSVAGIVAAVQAPNSQWMLARATEGADRLVVAPPGGTDASPLVIVRGTHDIAELVNRIELVGWFAADPSNGADDLELRFFRDDTRVATVALAEGDRLRWIGGRWRGDRLLTERSQLALGAWLTSHGCPVVGAEGR